MIAMFSQEFGLRLKREKTRWNVMHRNAFRLKCLKYLFYFC